MTTGEIESAAFHEASHGFIRTFFNMEISELRIDGAKGNCRFRVPDRRGDIGLFQDIAGSLAGRIAEDRVRGFKNEEEWRASGDYARAWDCALRLNAGDKVGAELLLSWLSHRTSLLVEKHFEKIRALAFKLLDSVDNNGVAQLTGEEVREAIA
jgi:hypothetical protein